MMTGCFLFWRLLACTRCPARGGQSLAVCGRNDLFGNMENSVNWALLLFPLHEQAAQPGWLPLLALEYLGLYDD